MADRDDPGNPLPDAAEALARLEELDRVLPRAIEDWVAARDREGLHVPLALKERLAEKARLRAAYRSGLKP
jgi:hypothetical protein